MNDLISRQAAIDALEKVAGLFPYRVPGDRDSYGSYPEAWNDAIGRAEMEIEELPSAQPEEVFKIGKPYPLEGFEVCFFKDACGADWVTIRKPVKDTERSDGWI